MVATSRMGLANTWNVAAVTEEVNFNFIYF